MLMREGEWFTCNTNRDEQGETEGDQKWEF